MGELMQFFGNSCGVDRVDPCSVTTQSFNVYFVSASESQSWRSASERPSSGLVAPRVNPAMRRDTCFESLSSRSLEEATGNVQDLGDFLVPFLLL